MYNLLKRTWAEINLNKIEENWREIRRLANPNAKIMAVIKADAYGHGAVELAKIYEQLGTEWFAVSNLDEALQLRRNGITHPILILGFTPAECADILAAQTISQTVLNYDYAEELSRAAQKANVTVNIHVKADTGMSRIGFYYHNQDENSAAVDEIVKACRLPGLVTEGIFTHFASADEGENGEEYTHKQFTLFTDLIRKLADNNINFKIRHCCNSAGIIAYPEFHLDMVRPGIILYGLSPSSVLNGKISISPAMELKSIISMVKTIPANTPVSYGRTYVTDSERRIATVPIGYADGYPRTLSGKADVLVCGKRAKIIGRICMDQLMIDVTDIPQAQQGSIVTLFGNDAGEQLPLDELAELLNTINYELACDISKRVPRVYLKNGKVIENSCYI